MYTELVDENQVNKSPKISLLILTYNHGKFVGRTLDSVFSQVHEYSFEILISDDASKDDTLEVLCDYQKANPNRIRILHSDYNVGVSKNFRRAMKECRGEYIAICEGDDFWIGHNKLATQVGFLEAHDDCTITSSGYTVVKDGNKVEDVLYHNLHNSENHFSYELKDLLDEWYTKTLTIVFRNGLLEEEVIENYKHFKDIHLVYHVLKRGYGYYFSTIFGAYRRHPGGVYSTNVGPVNKEVHFRCSEEMYITNRDNFTRRRLVRHTFELLNSFIYESNRRVSVWEMLRAMARALFLVRTIHEATLLGKAIFPEAIKTRLKKYLHQD